MAEGMCMPMSGMCFTDAYPIQLPFGSWAISTPSSLPGACAAVACLGALRHLLPALRLEFFLANAQPISASSLRSATNLDDRSLLGAPSDGGGARGRPPPAFAPLTARARPFLVVGALRRSPLLLRVADALLFGVNTALGFFSMLVACVARPAPPRRLRAAPGRPFPRAGSGPRLHPPRPPFLFHRAAARPAPQDDVQPLLAPCAGPWGSAWRVGVRVAQRRGEPAGRGGRLLLR